MHNWKSILQNFSIVVVLECVKIFASIEGGVKGYEESINFKKISSNRKLF